MTATTGILLMFLCMALVVQGVFIAMLSQDIRRAMRLASETFYDSKLALREAFWCRRAAIKNYRINMELQAKAEDQKKEIMGLKKGKANKVSSGKKQGAAA